MNSDYVIFDVIKVNSMFLLISIGSYWWCLNRKVVWCLSKTFPMYVYILYTWVCFHDLLYVYTYQSLLYDKDLHLFYRPIHLLTGTIKFNENSGFYIFTINKVLHYNIISNHRLSFYFHG